MRAEGVKRDRPQRRRLIEEEDRNGVPARKNLARRNSQKRIRATQAIECVRFLTADRREFSVSHPAAYVMGTVALVFHLFSQLRFVPRQGKLLFPGTHHSKNRGPHKQEE